MSNNNNKQPLDDLTESLLQEFDKAQAPSNTTPTVNELVCDGISLVEMSSVKPREKNDSLGITGINQPDVTTENLSHPDEASTSTDETKSDAETIVILLDCARGRNLGEQPSPSICKVSRILRDLSVRSFIPHLVSIGPIHRENEKLKEFEWLKGCYLNDLLKRCEEDSKTKETILEACLQKVKTKIPEIRESYAGVKKNYSDVELARMMVMDGCFILEFCFKHELGDDKIDYLPNKMQNLRIAMDLMLLENQVPFFVLQALFDCSMGGKVSFTLSNVLDNYLAPYIKLFHPDLLPEKKSIPGNVLDKYLAPYIKLFCSLLPEKIPATDVHSESTHVHSESTHVHSEPTHVHSESTHVHSESTHVHSDPTHPTPVHSEPTHVHSESTHVHSEPTHVHSEPTHVHSDPTHPTHVHLESTHVHSDPTHVHSESTHVHSDPTHPTHVHSDRTHVHSDPTHVLSDPTHEHDHVLGYLHKRYQHVDAKSKLVDEERKEKTVYHSIAELDRSGINFKPHQEGDWSMTIKFQSPLFRCLPWFWSKPTLLMPTLVIDDFTELILRNFIAYEQTFPQGHYYFTSYAHAMDMLINTQEDIAKLADSQVLFSKLGSHKEAAVMINKIGRNIYVTDFNYTEVFKQMDKYHNSFWPKNMAWLRRVYFNNPWNFLALVGAFILFGLTVVQTIFSIKAA